MRLPNDIIKLFEFAYLANGVNITTLPLLILLQVSTVKQPLCNLLEQYVHVLYCSQTFTKLVSIKAMSFCRGSNFFFIEYEAVNHMLLLFNCVTYFMLRDKL